MNKNLVNDLIKLKNEFEETKLTIAKIEGEIKSLMQQLKTEFDCSSLEQALEKSKTLEDELKNLGNKIEKEYNDLVQELSEIEGKTNA